MQEGNAGGERALPTLELLEVTLDGPTEPGPAMVDTGAVRSRWRIAVAIGVLTALLGGLGLIIVRSATPAAFASPLPTTSPSRRAAPPPGLEGFAELYLATYLTATGPDRAAQVRWFHPAAPEPSGHEAMRFARHITTLDAEQLPGGVWQLHLAADVLLFDGAGYQPDGIRHFAIGIIDTPHGFTATSLPVRMATPPPAPIPALGSETEIDDTGLEALVEGFLNAYLAGDGDVRTFAASGADIVPVTPPPFAAVSVEQLTGAPHGDSSIRLRAVGVGSSAEGSLRLEHHFVVTDAGGAWMIDAIGIAPPQPAATPKDDAKP